MNIAELLKNRMALNMVLSKDSQGTRFGTGALTIHKPGTFQSVVLRLRAFMKRADYVLFEGMREREIVWDLQRVREMDATLTICRQIQRCKRCGERHL